MGSKSSGNHNARGNFRGWSTKRKDGLPRVRQAKPEDEERKMRCLRASDAEWELIRQFSILTKEDRETAKTLLQLRTGKSALPVQHGSVAAEQVAETGVKKPDSIPTGGNGEA